MTDHEGGWVDEEGRPFTPDEMPPSARRAEVEAETPDIFRSGGSFILDAPETPTAVWGEADQVIWAEGEALIIAAPQGVGKTTVAMQVVKARLGLQPSVLGYPVHQTGGRILYLAMDRPRQAARAARRLFSESDREHLDKHLSIWQGPPPYDMAVRRDILAVMGQKAAADTIIIDSLKDAAIGIAKDEVGAGYNRARQQALEEGFQILELHHMRKSGVGNKEPNTLDDIYGSTWLTAGAGSVVLLWGEPGDDNISWRHLKRPANEVGPFTVHHDHKTGISTVKGVADPVQMAIQRTTKGLTVREFASELFNTPAPDRTQKMRAVRILEKYVSDGRLTRLQGEPGGDSTKYFPDGTEAVRRPIDMPDLGVHGEVHARSSEGGVNEINSEVNDPPKKRRSGGAR